MAMHTNMHIHLYMDMCTHVQTHTHKEGGISHYKFLGRGFPGGAVVENLPANAGDTGSSPGLGRSHMPRSN